MLPLSVMAQDRIFTIKGTVSHTPASAKVFLQHDNTVDSTMTKGGHFVFHGELKDDPQKASLMLNHASSENQQSGTQDVLSFYLEAGTLNVNSATDSIADSKITGSKLNDENQNLAAQLKVFEDKVDPASMREMLLLLMKMKAKTYTKPDSIRFITLGKKSIALMAQQDSVKLAFITTHPNSYLSLQLLKDMTDLAYRSPDKVLQMFNGFSSSVRNTVAGRQFLAGLQSVRLGNNAPDFEEYTTSGRPVKLSDYKGKYILVDFWASWCAPCRAENPNVLKAYQAYHDQGLEILGVSLDTKKEAWEKAIKEDKLPWQQVSDLKSPSVVVAMYNISGIPSNVLVGPDGKILAKNVRGEDLFSTLKKIFN